MFSLSLLDGSFTFDGLILTNFTSDVAGTIYSLELLIVCSVL